MYSGPGLEYTVAKLARDQADLDLLQAVVAATKGARINVFPNETEADQVNAAENYASFAPPETNPDAYRHTARETLAAGGFLLHLIFERQGDPKPVVAFYANLAANQAE
jgi:hypothetical protein